MHNFKQSYGLQDIDRIKHFLATIKLLFPLTDQLPIFTVQFFSHKTSYDFHSIFIIFVLLLMLDTSDSQDTQRARP